MQILESELDKLANNIKQTEKQREVLGKAIIAVKDNMVFPSEDPDILEDKFIFRAEPSKLSDLKVAGIDGGVVSSQYHGINLVVGRAVAVIFDFKNGQLLESNYFPDSFPSPSAIAYTTPVSNREFAINTSLERQKMEIGLAVRTIEKFKPKLLLLDGSILPHGMDKPEKSSSVYQSYSELLNVYSTLYETSMKENTCLAGVVEDSSGLRLTNLLDTKIVPGIIQSGEFPKEITLNLNQTKDVLKKTNDSNIMYHILSVGERSCVYSYSKDPEKHSILQDLEKWKNSVNSFYLKSVEFDRPIRIDFLCKGDASREANEIASIVHAMSMHNETYGCPSIIIEADARAKLSEDDLEMVYHRLKDKVGDLPSLFRLRRELRPF